MSAFRKLRHFGLDHVGPVGVGAPDAPVGEIDLDRIHAGRLVKLAGIVEHDLPVLAAVEPAHFVRDVVAVGFGLDQQLVHPQPAAGVGDVLDETPALFAPLLELGLGLAVDLFDVGAPVQRQFLAPGGDEHDRRCAELLHDALFLGGLDPRSPDSERRPIVLLLLPESAVERRDDVVETRVASGLDVVRRLRLGVPNLPVIALDDAAAAGLWPLHVLPGPYVRHGLEGTQHVLGVALRPREFAVFFAGVSPADAGRATAIRLKLHRDHQMVIGRIILNDATGDVHLVDALHDDNDHAAGQIVQAVLHSLSEPLHRGLADVVGLGLTDVVRIIAIAYQQSVLTFSAEKRMVVLHF